MRKFLRTFLTGLLLIVGSCLAGEGKFSGLVYADYYHMFSNHQESLQGRNGFWFRRLYFTYDYRFSSSFSMRVRFEAASSGDFTSRAPLIPFVKDLYLKWSKGSHSLIMGISPTPTFSKVEKIWGYRSVEKTPLDLYKMASSRDTGVSLMGHPGIFYYHIMLANGEGTKSEVNPQKSVYASLGMSPIRGLYIEGYGDFRKGESVHTDVYTYQGFISYSSSKLALGGLFAQQKLQIMEGGEKSIRVASAFLRIKMGKRIALLARADRVMDPLPMGYKVSYLPLDSTSPFTLLIFGADYRWAKGISLIPNVEIVNYDDLEKGDLVGKITLYYKW